MKEKLRIAAHMYGGSYSDLWLFLERVNQIGLDKLLAFHATDTIVTETDALYYCLHKDVEKLLSNKSSHSISCIPDEDINEIHRIYRSIGLEIPFPDVYYVDSFPYPYDKMDWTAFAPDSEDEKLYGINKGIYFLRQEMAPIYTQILYAHEVIHSFIGAKDPNLLGRGLEEGLADFLSLFIVAPQMYGEAAAIVQLENIKLGASLGYSGNLYFEFLRIVHELYRCYGLEYITDMVKSGRKGIKQIEEAIAGGTMPFVLQHPSQDNKILDRFMKSRIQTLYLSPHAYIALNSINEPNNIDCIAREINMDRYLLSSAIDELQEKAFLVLRNGDSIDYSDCKLYRDSRNVKYEL